MPTINDIGIYAVVARPAATNWTSATIWAGASDSTETSQGALTVSASVGRALTVLPDWPHPGVLDDTSTLDVLVPSRYPAPASATYANMVDNRTNLAVLQTATGWEILQYQNVLALGGDSYRLSDFIRGVRGTENQCGQHAIGNKFVMLPVGSYMQVQFPGVAAGTSRSFRAVSSTKLFADASPQNPVLAGVNLKPIAPAALQATRDAAGAYLRWQRRDRSTVEIQTGADLPLSETAESYHVVVYSDSTYATVKRTITVSTNAATYTAAQQVTDFGSQPTTIYYDVRQISSAVGDGTPTRSSVS